MPVIVGAKSRLKLEYPPYCSTEALMSNEMQSMSENLTSHEITWWSTHIKMSINETSCLIIKVIFIIYRVLIIIFLINPCF